MRNDEELNKLLDGVTIASGGVLPNIHSVLLPKQGKKSDAVAPAKSKATATAKAKKPPSGGKAKHPTTAKKAPARAAAGGGGGAEGKEQ